MGAQQLNTLKISRIYFDQTNHQTKFEEVLELPENVRNKSQSTIKDKNTQVSDGLLSE